MTLLDRFLKPIEVAGASLEKQLKAYKMDEPISDPSSMRHFVGLRECNSCDYFLPQGNAIIFIEETRLGESMQYHRNEYHYLNDQDKDDFAIKRIREEMRLKAYGSMLILCRLKIKCPEEQLIQTDTYGFWIVASLMSAEDTVVFDNLKDTLSNMLRGALGREMLYNTKVFPAGHLERMIQANDS